MHPTSRRTRQNAPHLKKKKAEVERVMNLKGGVWATAPKKGDRPEYWTALRAGFEGETFREVTKVSELRGGRYEALYPGPVRPGKPGTEVSLHGGVAAAQRRIDRPVPPIPPPSPTPPAFSVARMRARQGNRRIIGRFACALHLARDTHGGGEHGRARLRG